MKFIIAATVFAHGASADIDSLLADVAALTNETLVSPPPPLTSDERLAKQNARRAKSKKSSSSAANNPFGMFSSVFKMVSMSKGLPEGQLMEVLPRVLAMIGGDASADFGISIGSIMSIFREGGFQIDSNNPLEFFDKVLGPGMVEKIIQMLMNDPDIASKMTQLLSVIGGPAVLDQFADLFGGEEAILESFGRLPGIEKLVDNFDAQHDAALADAPRQLDTIISHLEFAASTEFDQEKIGKYNEIANLLSRANSLFEDLWLLDAEEPEVHAAAPAPASGTKSGAVTKDASPPNLQNLLGDVDISKVLTGLANANMDSDAMLTIANNVMLEEYLNVISKSSMMKKAGVEENLDDDEDMEDEDISFRMEDLIEVMGNLQRVSEEDAADAEL